MKKYLILAALSLLAQCQFEYPIDETPMIPLNENLLGKWECRLDEKDVAWVTVSKATKKDYVYVQFTSSDGAEYTAEGFESVVLGHRFLNLKFLTANQKGGKLPEKARWMPVEISGTTNRLTVRYVDRAYQKSDMATLRNYFEKNIENKNFFQSKPFEYKRVALEYR